MARSRRSRSRRNGKAQSSNIERWRQQWQRLPVRALAVAIPLGLAIGFLLPDLMKMRWSVLSTPAIAEEAPGAVQCTHPQITDGDTLRCAGLRIRLAGIDAPEMPGHCRPGRDCTPGDPFKAKAYLEFITRGPITCRQEDIDVYGRTVARCRNAEVDLSCAMLDSGNAVRRYGHIDC